MLTVWQVRAIVEERLEDGETVEEILDDLTSMHAIDDNTLFQIMEEY